MRVPRDCASKDRQDLGRGTCQTGALSLQSTLGAEPATLPAISLTVWVEQLQLCPRMASLVITQLLACKLPPWHLHRTPYPRLLLSKVSQENLCGHPRIASLKKTSCKMNALCTFWSLTSPGPAFGACLLPPGLALSAMWRVPSHSPSFLPLLQLEAD